MQVSSCRGVFAHREAHSRWAAWCLETWPLGAVAVAESLLAGAFAAGGAFAGGAFFGAVTCHRADCPLTGNCGAFLGGGATAASIV